MKAFSDFTSNGSMVQEEVRMGVCDGLNLSVDSLLLSLSVVYRLLILIYVPISLSRPGTSIPAKGPKHAAAIV
jgi:hypothetical protein